ncbi:MAG: dTMP kinase [Thaumarchaeota archaeon]|nr:dTMP kinase [Nitrososphaerota archaeon]
MSGRGYLIVIEGIDQSGKKTQSLLLEERIRREGRDVTGISFPDYSTPIGREIKKTLNAKESTSPLQILHMLLAANRWERENEITSWLTGGKIVVANRYSPSNLAYGTSRGFDQAWLQNLESGLPDPDLVIVLDIDPTTSTTRKYQDRDLNERDIELLTNVSISYKKMAELNGWFIVSGDDTVERIHEEIWAVVKGFFERIGPEK